ncbi:MAG: ribosomal protein S18-alanine N-acetyltransferase [Rhizobiaceae bacterium]
MRLPFAAQDHAIVILGERDAAAMARIHAEDFGRPWTADEFADLLKQNTVFGFAAYETGRMKAGPVGFVLARYAAGEGEILTVAVGKQHRRRGLGWKLMDAVLRELHRRRAEALFLEVDETNAPALGLYRRLGFDRVGLRPRYYEHADKPRTGALVMRRDLR